MDLGSVALHLVLVVEAAVVESRTGDEVLGLGSDMLHQLPVLSQLFRVHSDLSPFRLWNVTTPV